MGQFEEGNHWWEQRSTHGRDKIFASPTLFWEAAKEYFEATQKRKWKKKDWVGKDAQEVERETDTPYTISGLCIFLDIDQKTFWDYANLDSHSDFHPILSRIKEIIYTQKFEGAAVGAYNAMIISRDLHLRDNTDVTSGGEKINGTTFNLPENLSFEQLEKLANESDQKSSEDKT